MSEGFSQRSSQITIIEWRGRYLLDRGLRSLSAEDDMNSNKLATATLIFASVASLPGTGNAQTLEKIASSNQITVSYREAAVPFSYALSPTRAVGFSVDLTDAIIDDVRAKLKKPNLKVVRIPVTGQNRIPMLVDGTYDLECGSTTNTAARGKDVSFAISHFYTGTRLLVKTSSKIKNYADLAGKTVVAPAGSTNEKVVRKYSADNNLNLQFVAGKDYGESLQMVEEDRAAALALDDVLLFGLRANSKAPSSLEVVGDTLQVEPYGCMLRKDDPAFKKLVDGTITRLMKSGEFARLYNKWFESPIPPKGVVLGMPMSKQLKANLKALSDKPEF
ncbi:transporter substrate-binding domain-containing protein [Dechloromonas denitrificans]|nr:transporter substrate-binding domain-containing protein [Dechloromonas denitrificans]